MILKFIVVAIALFLFSPNGEAQDVIRVLILSGSNNHNWEETTNQLEGLFSSAARFDYSLTLQPDTLGKEDLKPFDVVVSNWNSWPDTEKEWPQTTRQALVGFIQTGGGFVTFHASTSAFYRWPEFKKMTTGAWLMEQTSHGKISTTQVNIHSQHHPVTQGMNGFYLVDELWINAEVNPDFDVLATAGNEQLTKEGLPEQPAVMVRTYGKGRVFHTLLGHDARALRTTGFRQLLLRGTEWAATGKVTQPLKQELQREKENGSYGWNETDTTLSLLKGENLVWQYNFNTLHGRPFFHPIYVKNNNLTCLSPDDHPWHLGQWFCWKFINKVNYWEYQPGTFQSAGITEIKKIHLDKKEDFSVEIKLEIVYHPAGGRNVLTEIRTIKVSPPQPDQRIWMDYQFIFEALADEVVLDRTPILGEENGKSWGGYAGLSIRFSQDFMNAQFTPPGGTNEINGRQDDWLYMEFTGIDGKRVGTQIMVAPQSRRNGWAWYAVNDDSLPFFYFSPACLYLRPLRLKKGGTFSLTYRILHAPGNVDRQQLNEEFQAFINQ